MVSKNVIIKDSTGLHLRPAGRLCKLSGTFKCKVTIKKNNNEANAKSVLSVLGACVKQNDEIEIICDGEDEETALEQIVYMLENEYVEE